MARRTTAFGREFKYGVLRMDYVSHLFPRSKVKWEGKKVHEKAVCDLPKLNLPGDIEHYTYESWQQYFGKFNQYTVFGPKKPSKRVNVPLPQESLLMLCMLLFRCPFSSWVFLMVDLVWRAAAIILIIP